MISTTKNRPQGKPEVTYTVRVESPHVRGEARHREQLDAIATLLNFSEESVK